MTSNHESAGGLPTWARVAPYVSMVVASVPFYLLYTYGQAGWAIAVFLGLTGATSLFIGIRLPSRAGDQPFVMGGLAFAVSLITVFTMMRWLHVIALGGLALIALTWRHRATGNRYAALGLLGVFICGYGLIGWYMVAYA